MFLEGFRFGMVLPIAVGPVRLFSFQAASFAGFGAAETGVPGVTPADALFIAAVLGTGSLLARRRLQKILLLFGALVLMAFGAATLPDALAPAPALRAPSPAELAEGIFLKSLAPTLSNPLPVVLWTGVFSARMIEKCLSRLQMYRFGGGAPAATPVFLSLVAGAGCLTSAFLPPLVIRILTGCVGALLIVFDLRTALRAPSPSPAKAAA